MKKVFAGLFAGAMALSVVGCGSSASALDLTGTWKTEEMEEFDGGYFEAKIKDDTVTVQLTNGTTGITYWEGSYEAPTEDTDEYEWTSKVSDDMDSTQAQIMGDEQEFSYSDGELTCELNISGITTNLTMTKE